MNFPLNLGGMVSIFQLELSAKNICHVSLYFAIGIPNRCFQAVFEKSERVDGIRGNTAEFWLQQVAQRLTKVAGCGLMKSVPVHFVVERADADFKGLGSFFAVEVVSCECGLNGVSLCGFRDFSERLNCS